jgi:hypothetical protein
MGDPDVTAVGVDPTVALNHVAVSVLAAGAGYCQNCRVLAGSRRQDQIANQRLLPTLK